MKDRCFLVNLPKGGGGNAIFGANGNAILQSGVHMPIVVRRTAAIGDALCASVVTDKLMALGFDVVFQTHIAIHCVFRRHPSGMEIQEPNMFCHVDLDGAYEKDPARRQKHFHWMFMEKANEQLRPRGIELGPAFNCKPHLSVPGNDREAARSRFSQYDRPWVFACPRSDTYNVRQISDGVWQEIAAKTSGTKFWLGRHPAPPNFIDLQCQHLDNVINWLSVADLLISVDTGPMHLAAALGVPVIAIGQSSSPDLHLNDQNDFVTVSPRLDCLNCQQNVCPKNAHLPPCQYIDPDLVAQWANARLSSIFGTSISAIVPIYQPEAKTLNRCLEAVLPQVSEVIVTCEMGNGKVPEGALHHDKIKYVRAPGRAIGYGRNVNFGARHSNGRYLMFLNDDVFLDPVAAEKMRDEMVPGVGMVAHLLRYEDGTIYHAGKRRGPGEKGWGHIDHRKHLPTITSPTEMENVCGASVMVDRKAYYGIDCFDEEFFIYAEDDDFSLRMRRSGKRIVYTPHATGVHMEHQSTQKIGDIMGSVYKANAIFGRKWGRYLEHNANRIPGTFDYV
jgi:GT2 family glycosyltransferase